MSEGSIQAIACSVIITKALNVKWNYVFDVKNSHRNILTADSLTRIYPLLDRLRPNISRATGGSPIALDEHSTPCEKAVEILSRFLMFNTNNKLRKIKNANNYEIVKIDNMANCISTDHITDRQLNSLLRDAANLAEKI